MNPTLAKSESSASSESGQNRVNPADKNAWVRAATTIAVVTALLLCLLKLSAWFITGSAAVLGSLADNAVDLSGSLAAAVAARYAALAADDNHRFGHHKAEALTAFGQVALIGASALLVLSESVQRLIWPQPIANSHVALWTLSISLLVTLFLVGFQSLAIRRSGSLILEGDRAQYAGDIAANVGSIVAVIISVNFALPRADAVAGVITAAVLLITGFGVAKRAIPQLMDEELPQRDRELIGELLNKDSDVLGYHALRTRQAGPRRFIQIDIEIDPELSFREAHAVTDRIELLLEDAFPDADVIVHADPKGEARVEGRVLSGEVLR